MGHYHIVRTTVRQELAVVAASDPLDAVAQARRAERWELMSDRTKQYEISEDNGRPCGVFLVEDSARPVYGADSSRGWTAR
jgi:hypothetical protein